MSSQNRKRQICILYISLHISSPISFYAFTPFTDDFHSIIFHIGIRFHPFTIQTNTDSHSPFFFLIEPLCHIPLYRNSHSRIIPRYITNLNGQWYRSRSPYVKAGFYLILQTDQCRIDYSLIPVFLSKNRKRYQQQGQYTN